MSRVVPLAAALALSAGPATAQGLISPGSSQPARSTYYDPFGPRPVFAPVVPASALPPVGGTAGGQVMVVAPTVYHPISYPPHMGYPYSYAFLGQTNVYYAPPAPSTFLGIPPLVDPEAAPRVAGVQGVRIAGASTAASSGNVTVEFPAVAELWVNGVKQVGQQQTWTVAVPTAGGSAPLTLAAKWTANGAAVQWDGSLTVAAGDHGRLTVLRGNAAPAMPSSAPAPRSK